MADQAADGQGVPTSVLDSFRGNKVYGRIVTVELPSPPSKLLARRPGRCNEPLEKAKQEHEKKSFLDRLLTPRDAWGNPEDQGALRLFRSLCVQWPDQLPESFVDEQQQRLNDHLSGRAPLPPEESLRLRRDLSLVNDIYRPGPRLEASLSSAEQSWLDERNLRFGNSLSMAWLGPVFGGPAAVTRALGGSEQQVAAANQAGVIVLDLVTVRMAMQRRALVPAPVHRQTSGLYIGPKRIYDFNPPLSSRHSIRGAKKNSRSKEKNTVAEPGIDMKADTEAINNGLGQRTTTSEGVFHTVNGRTYMQFDGHLVPHSGEGFYPLSRGEFKGLIILNTYGNTPQAALQMQREQIDAASIQRATEIWRRGR